MTTKHNTLSTDSEEQSQEPIPAGPRFVSEAGERWAIEQQLVADGVNLENRAIPARYQGISDPSEIKQAIATEADADRPNQRAIGYLNKRLAEVSDA